MGEEGSILYECHPRRRHGEGWLWNGPGAYPGVVDGEFVGIVTANIITDIRFIVRKRVGEEKARLVIYNVLALFDIAAVDGDVCSMALNTEMSDYEDAVLAVCAAREGADYIATNDEGLIEASGCPVTALHPNEVLEAIRETDG